MDYKEIRREYVHQPLLEESMNPDPFVQFDRWMEEAYPIFKEDTNVMALATTSADGRPSVRMVLLKGVSKEGFEFYTNYKSHKGQDLAYQPFAALLFFWPGMDRQIRIEGKVRRLPIQKSDEYFASRPLDSRISAIASPQSRKITISELKEKWSEVEESGEIERPATWGGFELIPDYFEFWQGRKDRFHDRIIYDKRNQPDFEIYRIAP